MSQRALSGQQFFHGSSAFLEPGDVIEPGSAKGTTNYPQLNKWRSQSVWMADTEKDAWGWADLGRGSSGTGRLSVYEVEPVDEPVRRRKLGESGPQGREYTASAARVVKRIDTPLGQQGTLPLPQDWKRTYDESWGGHPAHRARVSHFWEGTGPGTAHAYGLEEKAMEGWKRQERLEKLRSKGRYNRLNEPRLF